jgi:hypothetical protein
MPETIRRPEITIVTMIGVIDIIGEMCEDAQGDYTEICHPYFLRMQVTQQGLPTGQCSLVPALKGSTVFSGISIRLNMKNTLWIGQPSKQVLDAYWSERSGIVKAASFMDRAVNQ